MAIVAVSSRKVLRVFEPHPPLRCQVTTGLLRRIVAFYKRCVIVFLTASMKIEGVSKQATLCTMKVFTSSQKFAFAISRSGAGQVDSSPGSENQCIRSTPS